MRTISKNFKLTFNQIGRDIPTFADAASVADLIMQSGVKYDSVVIVYNKFVSAISYEAATMQVKGVEGLKGSSECTHVFFHTREVMTNLKALSVPTRTRMMLPKI